MDPAEDPPKKRDSARTREAILAAGQRLFAERGYPATGVREIAAAAGVSPSLVIRYFTSKDGVLRAALDQLLQIAPLIDGPRNEFGTRVADLFVHSRNVPSPVAMMLMATADPQAQVMCRELLEARITLPLAHWLGGSDGLLRARRLNLLWMGFFAAQRLIIEPDDAQRGDPYHWLAAMSQAIADDRVPFGA